MLFLLKDTYRRDIMNVDPDKIKELVLIFSKLDDDYQMELMKQAYVLSLKQRQKNLIQKENKKFKNNNDFEKEIEHRSNQRAKEALGMVEIFEKVGDKEKAELIVLLDKLSGGSFTNKTSIEIKINEQKVSMRDYLEEVFPGVNFYIVNKTVDDYIKDYRGNK
jgi:hypothetical protein